MSESKRGDPEIASSRGAEYHQHLRNPYSGATFVTEMPHYIVRAKPKPDELGELNQKVRENAFVGLRPFGKALTHSLCDARIQPDGVAIWEEEDYCSPPLAQERAAVLDTYFDDITVEQVNQAMAGTGSSVCPNCLEPA